MTHNSSTTGSAELKCKFCGKSIYFVETDGWKHNDSWMASCRHIAEPVPTPPAPQPETVTLTKWEAARIESALTTGERFAFGEPMNATGVINILREALALLRSAETQR